MKIAVGLYYLESNTFNKELVTRDAFIFEEGETILKYLHLDSVCKQNNLTLEPLLLASTLPAGRLKETDYWYFTNKILNRLEEIENLDGIWLHLHGSMEVENIGSGDLRLLKEIRNLVGFDIPISVVFDAHANLDPQIASYVNIVRGYHTIPHIDQPEAEFLAMKYLVQVIEQKQKITPSLCVVPAIVSGEKGISACSPLKDLLEIVKEYEAKKEIMTASVFMGDPWCDCPNSHVSVVVVPSRSEYKTLSDNLCSSLANEVFNAIPDFTFEVPTLEPYDAFVSALNSKVTPVFLSDAGDNTTGGAVGESTEILRLVVENYPALQNRVLITPIFDPVAFQKCEEMKLGETISVSIGTGRDETSVPVIVTGILRSKGTLLGYLNTKSEECGECFTLQIGNLDLMVSNVPTSFITPNHFVSAGVCIEDYQVIVLKQGYLFYELRPYAKGAIMAATKGATYLFIERLKYQKLIHPIIPFDTITSYSLN